MTKPRISIAMCTYNGESYIREQLLSIIAQSYPPCELIICDDNSQDGTIEIIRQLTSQADFPVKLHVQAHNVGIKENFSTAISLCTGDYISLSDQDDIWDTSKLQVFAAEIVGCPDGPPTLLYSDLDLIGENGQSLNQRFSDNARNTRNESELWTRLAFGNFMPGCSMVFDRQALRYVLPLPPEAILHDWWIALVISLYGRSRAIDRSLISYRIHSANSQGINSAGRTLDLGLKLGFYTVAKNNFLITLRQIRAAQERACLSDLALPQGLDDLCNILLLHPLARPLKLYRLGVRRISALGISVIVGKEQECDDTIGHR